MMVADDFRDFLTTGSAARLLEISTDTLRGYVRCGRIRPAGRTDSGALLFTREALDEFARTYRKRRPRHEAA